MPFQAILPFSTSLHASKQVFVLHYSLINCERTISGSHSRCCKKNFQNNLTLSALFSLHLMNIPGMLGFLFNSPLTATWKQLVHLLYRLPYSAGIILSTAAQIALAILMKNGENDNDVVDTKTENSPKANTYLNGIIKVIRSVQKKKKSHNVNCQAILSPISCRSIERRFVHSEHVQQSSSTNALNKIIKNLILFKSKTFFFLLPLLQPASEQTTTVTSKIY